MKMSRIYGTIPQSCEMGWLRSKKLEPGGENFLYDMVILSWNIPGLLLSVAFFQHIVCSLRHIFRLKSIFQKSKQESKTVVIMQYIFLFSLAPLAFASSNLTPRSNVLAIRQESEAFVPQSGQLVTNCPNPCGERDCLLVSRGDTCCSEGCKHCHTSIPLPTANILRYVSDKSLPGS